VNRWPGRVGVCLLLPAVLLAGPGGAAEAPLPLMDLHVHYNGWVAGSLPPEEAARQLQAHGALGGVVSSTPTANALRLAARAPGTLVPFFRPYLTEGHRGTWHQDPAVLREAEAALAAGQYRGIGEVHLSAANAGAGAGNPILVGLLRLAHRHRVPVQVHVDAPDIPVLEALLGDFPTVPVIWAHAGGWAEPGQVEALLVNHPNLWVEFSARDPYRYGSIAPLVEASGGLKTVAVSLTKIANDLRLMGSGPRAGLAEIVLPELQKGSSIMPGKVNPVIPEVVTQVAAQVIGNDAAITVGGLQGHFELNVFVPMMARNLLGSIGLLAAAARLLAEKCVDGVEANRETLERYAELTLSAATALNPYIGYDRATEIVKEAARSGRSLREVAREAGVDEETLDGALDYRAMARPHGR